LGDRRCRLIKRCDFNSDGVGHSNAWDKILQYWRNTSPVVVRIKIKPCTLSMSIWTLSTKNRPMKVEHEIKPDLQN